MSIITILVFILAYAIGNLPSSIKFKSLPARLLLNLSSKILLATWLYFFEINTNDAAFYILNTAMIVAVAFALYAENYSRFFERTDFAQSIFLVNMFAIGMPFENLAKFLTIFFIPYLASNAILITIGYIKEHEFSGRTAYIENFYNFFAENKISAMAFFVAAIFLLGTPPLQGFLWRVDFMKFMNILSTRLLNVLCIICLCSLGYVYFKWALALFLRKARQQERRMYHCHKTVQISLIAYAVVIILSAVSCAVFIK